MGALTPLGNSVGEFWDNLVAGKSGIAPLTLVDTSPYPTKIGGEVRGYDPTQFVDKKDARRMARFSQLAVGAAAQALTDAKLDMASEGRERIGVLLGTGIGGFPETEEQGRILLSKGGMRMSPFFIPMILPNMATANVSRVFGATGFSNTTITACAAGTQAIGEARDAIVRGRADVMITGGTEAGICELGLGGFCTIQALTRRNDDPTHASRPFDAKRDGFAPSEGSAVLILEREDRAVARGARIYGEVAGYSASSDAFHLVQPPEDGAGAARAMKWALQDAGVTVNEIDYINAHGTSTPLNDAAETRAIPLVFGERAKGVPISSTKSMIGHSLGASGALEAVVAFKTINEGVIHPTANYEEPDPLCDLDYVPQKARKADVKTVLSNSFGFGGQNACLVVRRYSA